MGVIAEVALTALELVGRKVAIPEESGAPGFRVTAPPNGSALMVTVGLDGAPMVKFKTAFPLFVS